MKITKSRKCGRKQEENSEDKVGLLQEGGKSKTWKISINRKKYY